MTNCSAVELIYSGEIEKLCLFQKEMKQRRIRYSNYLKLNNINKLYKK